MIEETDPAMIFNRVLHLLSALEKERYVRGELLVCVICAVWPLVFAETFGDRVGLFHALVTRGTGLPLHTPMFGTYCRSQFGLWLCFCPRNSG